VGPDYRIELADLPMTQDREVVELETGHLIDVAPLPSSAEREARLLAVRIPINKGVLGLRLGLIRKGDAARLAGVKTLDVLKQVSLAFTSSSNSRLSPVMAREGRAYSAQSKA
jgi:hypothetical protein